MRKKNLLKLIIGVGLVTVLAISFPLMSGCAAPAPTPTPTPTPEPTPTPTPTPEPAEEGQTWHFRGTACQTPEMVQRDCAVNLGDLITKMSDGRVTFDWYAGEELMPEEEKVAACQAGTLDLVQWFPAFGTYTDLHSLEAGMPFQTYDCMEFQTLVDFRGLGELFKESYEELGGLHYIANATFDPNDVISSKPLNTYEDFKGFKLQTPATNAGVFNDAGASCVWLPYGEVYMAGKTGIIDGFFCAGASELKDASLYEVFPYVTTPPIIDPGNVAYIMNLDSWNSLPESIQTMFYVAVRANNLFAHTIRHSGETADRAYFTNSTLDGDCMAKLYASGMKYIEAEAEKSARCAEAVRIILAYHEEIKSSGNYHRSGWGFD